MAMPDDLIVLPSQPAPGSWYREYTKNFIASLDKAIAVSGVLPARSDNADSHAFMLEDLARSGLDSDEVLCYPVAPANPLSEMYTPALSAFVVGVPAYCLAFPNNARAFQVRIKRKDNKYSNSKEVDVYLFDPPDFYERASDYWIIEGIKKAAKFKKHNPRAAVLAVCGCWNWQADEGLAPSLFAILRPRKTINTLFDGDAASNPLVAKAVSDLTFRLERLGLDLSVVNFAPMPGFKGIDDQLVEDPASGPVKLSADSIKFEVAKARLYRELKLSTKPIMGPAGVKVGETLIRNEDNAMLLLRHFLVPEAYYDVRKGTFQYGGKSFVDTDLIEPANRLLQGKLEPQYPFAAVRNALGMVISTIPKRDSISELVKALPPWDGVPRLDEAGTSYLHLKNQDLNKICNVYFKTWFTGWVLRLDDPGTKMDLILQLLGPQGTHKTMFFESLSHFEGTSYYLGITDIPKEGTGEYKTLGNSLRRATIVDLGEGVVQRGRAGDYGRFKHFVSLVEDEYRVAYAKTNTLQPRGFGFVSSSNTSLGVDDPTGNRRELRLEITDCTPIPYAEKLLLIAEVIHRKQHAALGPWWELSIDVKDLPASMTEEYPHLTDPQALLNADLGQPYGDFEPILLDELIPSACKYAGSKTGELFISEAHIRSALQNSHLRQQSVTNAMLRVKASVYFPYVVAAHKPKKSSLVGPIGGLETFYTSNDATNQQIRGFKLTPKATPEPKEAGTQ